MHEEIERNEGSLTKQGEWWAKCDTEKSKQPANLRLEKRSESCERRETERTVVKKRY